MDDWTNKGSGPLVAPDRLKQLSVRSDRRGLIHLFSQMATLAVTTTLIARLSGTWWVILPFMAQGIVLNCLYAGQHEMSHRTAFKSRALNLWVGEIIGFLEILPAQWDRKFHFAHHRNTQNPAKDPELLAFGINNMKDWRISLSGLPYGVGQAKAMVSAARGIFPDYVWWLNDEERLEMKREAQFHLAGYSLIFLISLYFHSWIALKYWLGPLLVMKVFYQFQNMGEHTGLGYNPDTLKCTRTLKGPFWMRWLVWNMSYHAAHHTYPSVPFFRLPELDRNIRQKSDAAEASTRGYIQAQIDVVRTFRRAEAVDREAAA
ncbi:MAG TPA: fatty acid desaturase [Alphaproteobacteria bacterium]|nr:fatty acid desaturase [Alphaproteobacteria bacterium]